MNPEDEYIFGERGFYYVVIDDLKAGYFSTLTRARKYVRKVLRF